MSYFCKFSYYGEECSYTFSGGNEKQPKFIILSAPPGAYSLLNLTVAWIPKVIHFPFFPIINKYCRFQIK